MDGNITLSTKGNYIVGTVIIEETILPIFPSDPVLLSSSFTGVNRIIGGE